MFDRQEAFTVFSKAPELCGGGINTHTKTGSIVNQNEAYTEQDTSKDSRIRITDGATDSKKTLYKLTYEDIFYRPILSKMRGVVQRTQEQMFHNKGFPVRKGAWCHHIKDKEEFLDKPLESGGKINTIQYLGIAADEPERIERHTKKGFILPLVDIGWDEAFCRKWCEDNNLLSPIYTTSTRGGCWFCHNQGVGQLRNLRRDYPELWQNLLRLDKDSPVTFHADGHTVHDFDRRFQLEDEGFINPEERFHWEWIKYPPYKQISIFDIMEGT